MVTFGNRLKKLRKDKGLTQEELGKILKVTNVAVAKWESDNRFPDKDLLVQIADYFNTSLDYLLGRTENIEGIIQEADIDGHHYEFELDKKIFPNGITREQMIDYIKELEERNKELEKEAELSRKLKNLLSENNKEE
ncbi:helix-turn-helix transcriptional regulator [Clostridium sporogenes]|uniref:Helix-turn-helix transcriptional regulator n=1 Tax=Clostridium sporogenes TaxID=1509 RepID=A0A7X5SZC2_CLOSG|nr:helix-turn-helix transcriptional regulator [Clostridium sporogenes]AJD29899.1 helix-turn-helix family protein [Clostridium botulinum Prevot_594]MBY7016331.1 helix-turn-helix transcriptional regulator [Clostridium sporogenes]NFQ18475.1 helix-turn-helix transcriptional regulator [Clostridium sporogenes]NFQ21972.1 helix-turn-helix transcriptional regulator [Clostridium sporogenes]NFQ28689.1 helix-turn-helix transcriptional regulator [Clostridium sporogenes]